MLGTWSEHFTHAFEKQGQFGAENNTIIRWGIKNSSEHLWSVPKNKQIFNYALKWFFFLVFVFFFLITCQDIVL